MDIKKIQDIIDLLKETDISEIEVTDEDGTLRLCRHEPGQHPSHAAVAPVQYMPAVPLAGVQGHGPATISDNSSSQVECKGHIVRSPMVGTLYTSSSPETPVFVSIGQTVKVGDTLCIIEAMKMFNEIESDRAGKIIDILASTGDPIEFDQALFVIE